MKHQRFAITYDYRCPFARNANEHVVMALRDGAPYDVYFSPFVLGGAYIMEGGPSIFDDPSERAQLSALAIGIIVRDRFPEKFLDTQMSLFDLRHEDFGDLRDESQLRLALERANVDSGIVFKELADGWPYASLREEHERAAAEHDVWGVPTFIANDHAAFVRVMTRPKGDAKVARSTVDTIVGLLFEHVEINEFKHTSIPR